jgi:Na+/H+ antiporter NhaD/arsenite permease-like protein
VAGGLSAILANDVVVYAMTPLLCLGLRRRRLDPRPFVIAVAGAANAGSAATVIGNPQNILLGQTGNLDFWAFSAVCGPPAILSLAIVYAVVLLTWRKRFVLATEPPHHPHDSLPLERAGLGKALVATAALLVLFTTPLPHVEGVLLVAGALLISRRLATRRYLALVDWPLLVLFGGLFVVTAALAQTGLPEGLVAWLADHGLALDALPVMATLTLVGSNSIGNVPLVMLLLAVLPDPSPYTYYALALLSTLAGNLLLTGSLANIIAVERARDVGVELGFLEHARCGIPITLASLAIALVWLRMILPAATG